MSKFELLEAESSERWAAAMPGSGSIGGSEKHNINNEVSMVSQFGGLAADEGFKTAVSRGNRLLLWLVLLDRIAKRGATRPTRSIHRQNDPAFSGEVRFRVQNAAAVVARLERHYRDEAIQIDMSERLRMEFAGWRFSARPSLTGKALGVRVETFGDKADLQRRVDDVAKVISIAGFWQEWAQVA